MEYSIFAKYDVEVIEISDDTRMFYIENENELKFFISVDKIDQLIPKNFYVEVRALDKFPVRHGYMYAAITSDGDEVSLWELDG